MQPYSPMQRPDPASAHQRISTQLQSKTKGRAAPTGNRHLDKTAPTGFIVLIYKKVNAQQHLTFITSLQESVKRKKVAQTATA